MGTLKVILTEIIHLFVDDGSLALALIIWSGTMGIVAAILPQTLAPLGITLFAGCALILLCNVVAAARSRANTRN